MSNAIALVSQGVIDATIQHHVLGSQDSPSFADSIVIGVKGDHTSVVEAISGSYPHFGRILGQHVGFALFSGPATPALDLKDGSIAGVNWDCTKDWPTWRHVGLHASFERKVLTVIC